MKVFLLTFLIPYSIALRCFQCSDLNANQAKDCPSSSKEISQWSNLPGHYSENNDKKGLACVLGVDSSKNVYFQAKLDENQCKSSGYQTTIKIKINQKSNTESEVLCCTKDGCNWNYTTTQNNLSFDEILVRVNPSLSLSIFSSVSEISRFFDLENARLKMDNLEISRDLEIGHKPTNPLVKSTFYRQN